MTGIVHAGVVGNDVVLIAAVSQTADAVPTISVKGAFADNRVADIHAEIESVTSIIPSDVVRPETVLDGCTGVETVSQTAFGKAITNNRSSPSLNAYTVREPMLYDASPHAGIHCPHQMNRGHGEVNENTLIVRITPVNTKRFQFTPLLFPTDECRESVSHPTIPLWMAGTIDRSVQIEPVFTDVYNESVWRTIRVALCQTR